MSNSRAFAIPIVTGQKVTAGQFNALDDGQYYALTRTGTTPLLGNTTIQGGSYLLTLDFSDNVASYGLIKVGDAGFIVQSVGSGNFTFADADKVSFGGATSWPSIDAHTLTDYAPAFAWQVDQADWNISATFVSTKGTSLITANMYLSDLPKGMVITSVKVEVKGFTGGTLPGTMPTVALYRYDAGAYGTPTATVGSATDSSASNAAFTANHSITISGLSHTVLNTSHYILQVTTPTGGGTSAGFTVYRCYITGTLSKLRTA